MIKFYFEPLKFLDCNWCLMQPVLRANWVDFKKFRVLADPNDFKRKHRCAGPWEIRPYIFSLSNVWIEYFDAFENHLLQMWYEITMSRPMCLTARIFLHGFWTTVGYKIKSRIAKEALRAWSSTSSFFIGFDEGRDARSLCSLQIL